MAGATDGRGAGLTRRQAIVRASATAAGVTVLGGSVAHAAQAAPGTVGQALGPGSGPLSHKAFDAAAFHVYGNEGTGVPDGGHNYLYFTPGLGVQPFYYDATLVASIDLPVGAVIEEITAAYCGSPTVSIHEREIATGATSDAIIPRTLVPGVSVLTPTNSTVAAAPPLVIKPGCSYSLRLFCPQYAAVTAVTIGYTNAAFSPIAPQRVLDTRGSGKVQPGQEITVDLSGASPFGSAAVLNITADSPDAAGFLSAYSADIAFPNTSVLNYSPVQANIATTAIVTMGDGNRVKIRAADGAVNVIVDVVGYLL